MGMRKLKGRNINGFGLKMDGVGFVFRVLSVMICFFVTVFSLEIDFYRGEREGCLFWQYYHLERERGLECWLALFAAYCLSFPSSFPLKSVS